jgi:hypothetical protein
MVCLGAEDTTPKAPTTAEKLQEHALRAAEAAANPPKFDLSFPGGTLAEFLEAIRGASGEKPNAFIPTDAESLAVPKMDLRGVTTRSVMESLAFFLSEEYGRPVRMVGASWVLVNRPDRRKAQAYYVGDLLSKFKMQDVTTAIETTWRTNKTQRPELKYHEDTQLLIVFAEPSHMDVVTNVLSELRQALAGHPAEPKTKR